MTDATLVCLRSPFGAVDSVQIMLGNKSVNPKLENKYWQVDCVDRATIDSCWDHDTGVIELVLTIQATEFNELEDWLKKNKDLIYCLKFPKCSYIGTAYDASIVVNSSLSVGKAKSSMMLLWTKDAAAFPG